MSDSITNNRRNQQKESIEFGSRGYLLNLAGVSGNEEERVLSCTSEEIGWGEKQRRSAKIKNLLISSSNFEELGGFCSPSFVHAERGSGAVDHFLEIVVMASYLFRYYTFNPFIISLYFFFFNTPSVPLRFTQFFLVQELRYECLV